jgi:hypothetical protein
VDFTPLSQLYQSVGVDRNLSRRRGDRIKLDHVPDETTRAIDRIFDLVDNGVAVADRVLNRYKCTDEQLQQQRRKSKRREIIDAEIVEKPKKPRAEKSAPAALVKKLHFYIVEGIDPKSGHTIFIVTDGRNARTECSTRDFAAQILRALEKAP